MDRQVPHGAPAVTHSLRVRLPAFIAVLIAVALAAVVWVAFREMERTLIRAGADRAQGAADQLANLFERSVQQSSQRLRQVTADSDIRDYLDRPSDETRSKAQARLKVLTAVGPRRVELWNRRGELVLDASTSSARPDEPRIELPIGRAPASPGLHPFEVDHGVFFSDAVLDISVGDFESPVPPQHLGYLVVRSTVSVNPPGIIGQLVGRDAHVELGNRAGEPWSDLSHVVVGPPVDRTKRGAQAYRDGDGRMRLGAMSAIRDTPWAVWVDFPQSDIVAPARAFLRRTIGFGALYATIAALAIAFFTVRMLTPLSRVTAAANAVAGGDYSQRVPEDRPDEIGQVGAAFNTMTRRVSDDMAARQAAEAALHEREASFRALFADNPLPMWVYDSETLQFLEVNGAAIQHYGYSREEFLSMRLTDIRPLEDVPKLLTSVAERRDRWQQSGGWRHTLKSGAIIDVEITSHVLTFDHRQATLVVAQDVTDRRQLEDQLRQAQKMEAIGQLAGGVAHDFNNLLTAILGYANLLKSTLEPGDPRSADVEEIDKAGFRAAGLTRQLLTFSRQQMLQPRRVNLNDVVPDTARMLRRLIGEHITLATRLAPNLAPVHADPSQLEQIIMNLVVNARDAMPHGGTVSIETANVTIDETHVSQRRSVKPGPYVMLAVSDTGVGMTDEVQRRLFEPFFTTKERGKGTGLGLATVYGIVKQSEGDIWVYSEPERGSVFKVYLPQAEAVASEERTPDIVPAAAAGSETLLVVEDEEAVRFLSRVILERAGYHVIDAPSAAVGEALFSREVDLLVTDVIMPGSSGPALYQRLVNRQPGLKVLYMSGYTDDMITHQGNVPSGVAFLQKPFRRDDLLRKVRAALDQQPPAAA